MIFQDRPLREVVEADVRQLLASRMPEHLHLEYKSALYGRNDAGHREFLQDICMFANAQGGILILGVHEERNGEGQPSGVPDPDAILGLDAPNPQQLLLAYDAQIVACIEDRLAVESAAIRLADGCSVLAFRVPNSMVKPHRVSYRGRINFPSRRERNRYELSVQEIKELTLRTASSLERAAELLEEVVQAIIARPVAATLSLSIVPVFFRDFLVDLAKEDLVQAVGNFDVSGQGRLQHHLPEYTFQGLLRGAPGAGPNVMFKRNGLLTLRISIPGEQRVLWQFELAAIDLLLHEFVLRTQDVYRAAEIASPVLLQAAILPHVGLRAVWNRGQEFREVAPQDYVFPPVQASDIFQPVERTIRPICDHVHQMFGREHSSCFDADGRWIDPRR